MDVTVKLEWQNGLRFEGGREAGPRTRVDGEGKDAPSPMETLLLALAGCTAADVVEIARKMREPIEGSAFEVRVEGERAPEPPRRYTRIRLRYRVVGAGLSREKLERAIELSQGKYCSVLHTLRPDLTVDTELELSSE